MARPNMRCSTLPRRLAEELKGTPVKMCYLSPGIVVTDMLVPPPDRRGEAWEQVKKILNILADTVETVTPFLVEGMLNAKNNGDAVRWLTKGKVMRRFFMSRFRKRDIFTPLGLVKGYVLMTDDVRFPAHPFWNLLRCPPTRYPEWLTHVSCCRMSSA